MLASVVRQDECHDNDYNLIRILEQKGKSNDVGKSASGLAYMNIFKCYVIYPIHKKALALLLIMMSVCLFDYYRNI